MTPTADTDTIARLGDLAAPTTRAAHTPGTLMRPGANEQIPTHHSSRSRGPNS